MDNKPQPILSICIPSHNRVDMLLTNLEPLIALEDDRFDVVVSDTSDKDEHIAQLKDLEKLPRVKVFRNSSDTHPCANWRLSLESADGIFGLQLLDRDRVLPDRVVAFIEFLEANSDCVGGIAERITTPPKASVVYEDLQQGLMDVPYCFYHPSGIVYRVEKFKAIKDREKVCHGCFHDIMLGRLFPKGKLFRYNSPVWALAPANFYLNNKSGFKSLKDSSHPQNALVHPFGAKHRILNANRMLSELNKLPIPHNWKMKKREQIVDRAFWLATCGMFQEFRKDWHMAHYGLEVQKLTLREQVAIAQDTLRQFKKNVIMSDAQYKKFSAWIQTTAPYIIDPEVEKAAKAGTA